MMSEDQDNKFRDAAEHHHPAYDEKAWEKMKLLLDKHLPVERPDKRRRFIFFLWLFLSVVLAGIVYMFLKDYSGNFETVAINKPGELTVNKFKETEIIQKSGNEKEVKKYEIIKDAVAESSVIQRSANIKNVLASERKKAKKQIVPKEIVKKEQLTDLLSGNITEKKLTEQSEKNNLRGLL